MSTEFRAGERVVSLAHLYPCCECGGNSDCYASFDGPEGKEFICEKCVNDEREDAFENMPHNICSFCGAASGAECTCNDDCGDDEIFDDDGQPSEYEEWQDYMGGDDWDHGQYDQDYYGGE